MHELARTKRSKSAGVGRRDDLPLGEFPGGSPDNSPLLNKIAGMAVRDASIHQHGGTLAHPFRLFLAVILGGSLLSTFAADAVKKAKKEGGGSKNAAEDQAYTNFFNGPIQRFEITIPKEELGKLRNDPGWGSKRPQVPVTIAVGSNVYEKVSLHLKGAAGSFRSIGDARPAFTINFGKLNEGQKFHGMRKIHLNNSVQDPSQLSELFCGELYRRAGVPATRATHAFVSLNGRDLGLYVLKEGFDKSFLRRNFGDNSGNLYDGGFVQDIESPLERDSGDGPDNKADLRQLFKAAMESNEDTRLKKLEEILDIDRFVTLSALQFLFDDWDGYIRNHNNYRIYHDPTSGKFVFLPHGMDQMFQNPNNGIVQTPNSILGRQVFAMPTMRAKLMERITELTNTVFTTTAIQEVLASPQKRLAEALVDRKKELSSLNSAGSHFRSRVQSRLARVTRGSPKPAKFDSNRELSLAKNAWAEHQGGGVISASYVTDNGLSMLMLAAEQPGSTGSFRTTVLLAPGVYRFEARAQTKGVQPMETARGTGAGIRISREARVNKLVNTTGWSTLTHDFEVLTQSDVPLVVELYANEGSVSFDVSSLKLRRL